MLGVRKACRELAESLHDIQQENAKLRELAVLNWEWAHNACRKDTCRLSDKYCGNGIDQDCNYERRIYDLMCELGMHMADQEQREDA